MTIEIPDLWPPEVARVKVLTPLLILRHQAGLLRKRSANVLEAEVTTLIDSDRHLDANHSLDVLVPAMDRFQVRLLTVFHSKLKVYPAYISAEHSEYGRNDEGRCNSQAEFIQKLGEVLTSPDTRSVIESLLAQATEALDAAGALT